MILKIIAALTMGIAIGININNTLDKKRGSKVGILEDLITIHEMHEEELKDTINYYKDEIKYYETGMNETLVQNIDLKRRLNNGKSRDILN